MIACAFDRFNDISETRRDDSVDHQKISTAVSSIRFLKRGTAVLSIITGGGKWVEMTIPADPLYQHLLLTAEKKFWRCVETGEPPHLFGVEPPRPRIEAVRIVDMSSSNSWAKFAGVFCQTRARRRPRFPMLTKGGEIGFVSQNLAAGPHRLCFVGFRSRTPGPPPFSSMNSTPAFSRARRTLRSFAVVSHK